MTVIPEDKTRHTILCVLLRQSYYSQTDFEIYCSLTLAPRTSAQVTQVAPPRVPVDLICQMTLVYQLGLDRVDDDLTAGSKPTPIHHRQRA